MSDDDDFSDDSSDFGGGDDSFEQVSHFATYQAAMSDLRLGFFRATICEFLEIEPGPDDVDGQDIDEFEDVDVIGAEGYAVKVRECAEQDGANEGSYCVAVEVGAGGWRDFSPASSAPAQLQRGESSGLRGKSGGDKVDFSQDAAWRACWWGAFADDAVENIFFDSVHEGGAPFEVLADEAAVLRRMAVLMRQLARKVEEFGSTIGPALCVALLRRHGWQPYAVVDAYFDAPTQTFIYERFGVATTVDGAALAADNDEWDECPVCMSTEEGDFVRLGTDSSGALCVECWTASLAGWMESAGAGVLVHECPLGEHVVPDTLWQRFLSDADWKRFTARAADEYAATSKRALTCVQNPRGGCSCVIESSLSAKELRAGEYAPVRCEPCGAAFCLACRALADSSACAALGDAKHNCGDHRPATCAMVEQWLAQATAAGGDDSATAAYLKANTRKCPQCHAVMCKVSLNCLLYVYWMDR